MKSPAFQFYPSDWLSSQRVQMLTLEEEGAYIRLLSFCWQHGSIPSDPEQAARLIGKGGSTTVARVVLGMFDPMDGNDAQMVHSRLEAERAKQREWREKSAKGGKKSADKRRKNNAQLTDLQKEDQGCLKNGTNQTPTLLSSDFSLQSSKQTKEAASPVLPFSSKEFAEAWETFRKHRSEIKKKLTPTAERMALKWCADLGERRAIVAIEHTIRKGWQGLREPDATDPQPRPNQPKPAAPPEPEYWREMLNEDYPGSAYSRGGMNEGTPWQSLDTATRSLVLANLPRWLARTGRRTH